jgi:hypothetical protein
MISRQVDLTHPFRSGGGILLAGDAVKICMLFVVVLTLAATTEAATVTVTYLSDPPGATLYEEIDAVLKPWGYTPFKLKYDVPSKWTGCIRTNPMQVRWMSGAMWNLRSVELCANLGKNQRFTFLRPPGVPGRDVDAQFAHKLARQHETPAPLPATPPSDCLTAVGSLWGNGTLPREDPRICTH